MAITFESISAPEVESLRAPQGGRGQPSALQELFDVAKKTPGQWFVVYSSDKPKDPVQAFKNLCTKEKLQGQGAKLTDGRQVVRIVPA